MQQWHQTPRFMNEDQELACRVERKLVRRARGRPLRIPLGFESPNEALLAWLTRSPEARDIATRFLAAGEPPTDGRPDTDDPMVRNENFAWREVISGMYGSAGGIAYSLDLPSGRCPMPSKLSKFVVFSRLGRLDWVRTVVTRRQ